MNKIVEIHGDDEQAFIVVEERKTIDLRLLNTQLEETEND